MLNKNSKMQETIYDTIPFLQNSDTCISLFAYNLNVSVNGDLLMEKTYRKLDRRMLVSYLGRKSMVGAS